MAASPRAVLGEVLADAVPFLAIAIVWSVIMLAFYAVFLFTRPPNVAYEPWVFASVFVVPGIAFLGHILKQAIHG
ncbi:MAG: hypothetical protein GWN79_02175 [Actinobacteria bacterium]|nr:hypothetical protein [Actinomycetota bacterium]NIU17967.1 hypothetical protein [Actinomycetota bacterium]NIU64532.1 hypothetical protein [Actinomycetota bacterium]NIV85772.1 hypothetical protein [Actinomycetota bacterium]NIW26323.1 hypothetical protein [Actinomycetota bacterium]